MIRHTVVYHGYNEHLFPGRAHLRAFLGENWTALEPSKGGTPTSAADLTSFIRGCDASAVFAAHALPAFGDNADLKIRSIVPIGHPIARAFVNYTRRSGKQGEAESFVEFVRAELARSRNSLYVANGQSALLAGGKWHHDLSDPNEIGPIVREICEHAEIGLAHFPQLMNCVLVKALLSVGSPIAAPVALRPIAENDLLTVLAEALEQLPVPLRDDLVVRNSADLLLFDEVAKAWAAVVPAASIERERILEVADAAAELTRHRRSRAIVTAPTTVTNPAPQLDQHVFFRHEPVLGWWPEPNATLAKEVLGRRVVMEVDEQGYRPVPGQPAIGNKTLAVYGCSFTFGWALPVDETFCAVLQARLPDWRVENHGMSGFGTGQNLLQLERASLWQPGDYVTFCWIPEHMRRAIAHHSTIQGYQFPGWLASPISVYPKAHIDDGGSLGIKHISFKRPELAGIDLDDFGPDPYYIEYVTARLFGRAAEIVREAGGHFFVTVLRFAMSDNLRGQLEAAGIPVVDASVNGREYSLMPFDGHPNARANEIFAERIYAYIADHAGLEASAAHSALQARSA
jgi:hypothetical protein